MKIYKVESLDGDYTAALNAEAKNGWEFKQTLLKGSVIFVIWERTTPELPEKPVA